MEGIIQFVANYAGWTSVKKLKVTEQTDPRTVMEFLASLCTGMDNKVEGNLGKLVDLKKIDAVIEEEVGSKSVEAALAAVKGPRLGKVINELCVFPDLQKKEIDEIKDFCKAYATRKAMKKVGLMVDYSAIEIPGMKRLMKKKI